MDMDTLWTLGLLGPLAMLMYVGWLVPLGVSVAPQGAQPGIGCIRGAHPRVETAHGAAHSVLIVCVANMRSGPHTL